jgi:hypothetical protein
MKTACAYTLMLLMTLGLSPMMSSAQSPNLAEIARENRLKMQQAQSRTFISTDSQSGDNESQYKSDLQGLIARRAFSDLDAKADQARSSKQRFSGGVWKLYIFYETVSDPASGDRATVADWEQHLAKLEEWTKASPQSITARVALAQAYRDLAWKARGGGFANKVSDASWQQFDGQEQKAYKTLVDADALPGKCPHWYLLMLEIARDQGLKKEEARALFDHAVALEPGYYHYYREYALNLLPKWNGQPGDAEAFAEESYRRIGGPEGAFVYFEIATVLYCMCYEESVKPTLSWDVLKQGFAEVEAHYGMTLSKLNRFALLAYLYRDREIARKTLLRVNDGWDASVWRKLDSFNAARTWAGLPSL